MAAPVSRDIFIGASTELIQLKAAEKTLSGATIDDKTLARAGDAAADEAECISDVRGSVAYKCELLRVYVARAVRQALSSNAATH
jgi:aerobic carbon-monoxide dehydrogenase medium subunit